jgi:hypothetical protein
MLRKETLSLCRIVRSVFLIIEVKYSGFLVLHIAYFMYNLVNLPV